MNKDPLKYRANHADNALNCLAIFFFITQGY